MGKPIIWVVCPKTAFAYFRPTKTAGNHTFIELKRWARKKFKGITVTRYNHVWVLAPQPGCENDIAEMSP